MTDIGPGDIVVCVDAVTTHNPSRMPLQEGQRYQVERIARSGLGLFINCLGWCNECQRRHSFYVSRFRPLHKSDSEIFHKMIKLKETA